MDRFYVCGMLSDSKIAHQMTDQWCFARTLLVFVGEYLRRTDHIGVSACFGMLKCSLLYLSSPVSYDLMNRSSIISSIQLLVTAIKLE